ncbi:class I SAM-dependent methyltransferase [Natrarchaeobius oligotrophus]|uniref:Class I SAM-dependent methyltransferase n=1 Tax=Natrarchaeobius chitinivorans TaxID=1679083 RepID=A0A3N6NPX3_NATCH|nr:class I SAM-dependent methyltransferase [Natrarchaeobius chitinivorans]RQH01803.1 class I SAM-dependent methyltransferase [Natrarchaeobius chitinivorans]
MSTFHAYLEARRPVDDRALDDRAFEAFADGLAARSTGTDEPLRIVEVGGGVGTMIARLVERNALSGPVRYRLIDRDADAVDRARERLPDWLEAAGCTVERTSTGLVARSSRPRSGATDAPFGLELEVTFEIGDAFAASIDRGADAVIGSAVFDLVDLDRALPWVASVLEPDGLLYAPLTYDGATGFAPVDPFDDRLEEFYHRHMDEVRDEPGGSRAGRRLVGALEGDDLSEVLAVGGSDWVLRPHDRPPSVESAERVVLGHVLETIDDALADCSADAIDPRDRRRWLDRREDELEAGELTGFARHVDVLARADSTGRDDRS